MSAATGTPGDSAPVRSNQPGVHPRLAEVVRRHLERAWEQPPHGPTVAALEALRRRLPELHERPLVLDSGCGTGESTLALAARHPEALVLGIDRSAARLRRGGRVEPRCDGRAIWLRAELTTAWRWLADRGVHLRAHYLLYPNPWPKAAQLQRRWHGHPIFPTLLALGGRVELRTNWRIYAEEFAIAAAIAGRRAAPAVARLAEGPPLTAFERKYAASGHALYRVALAEANAAPESARDGAGRDADVGESERGDASPKNVVQEEVSSE
ncbi:MAG: hypothetical protein KC486_26475 [Myxococcales bacterium]|nr:hypothetical protein [Myxococcales bacterium]